MNKLLAIEFYYSVLIHVEPTCLSSTPYQVVQMLTDCFITNIKSLGKFLARLTWITLNGDSQFIIFNDGRSSWSRCIFQCHISRFKFIKPFLGSTFFYCILSECCAYLTRCFNCFCTEFKLIKKGAQITLNSTDI